MHHWRMYLYGRSFIIKMDHFSLKFLLNQCMSTVPQQQWASKLIGFDFQVEYKPGASNVITDALSRCDAEAKADVTPLSAPAFATFDSLCVECTASPKMQQLRDEVVTGTCGDQCRVIDGLVTHKGCIYIPPQFPSLLEILATAHGLSYQGTKKTLHRLQVDFYVLGACTTMRDFIWACMVCQCNEIEQLHPAGLLSRLDVPTMVWADIAIDFIEGLPKVKWKLVILTVMD
jgi:hypothetical protein